MTTRNLNKTWLDVITAQYKQDFSDSVEFPIRYLLHNPLHKADLYYEIPYSVEPAVFKKSLIDFHIYTRAHGYQEFQDENIKVWKRVNALRSDHSAVEPEFEPELDLDQELNQPAITNNSVKRRLQHVEQKFASRSATAGSEPQGQRVDIHGVSGQRL